MELTQQKLKELLHYNELTGVFTWKNPRARCLKAGDLAGTIDKAGYVCIKVHNKTYKAHRLAWLHKYNKFPDRQMDHINHKKNDNRIENLREADHTTNQKNRCMRKDNATGINGVHWYKPYGKWLSHIGVKGKQLHLGYFTDKNEAICARLHANKLYGFHTNHGKAV